jgi:hypothetical protein
VEVKAGSVFEAKSAFKEASFCKIVFFWSNDILPFGCF